MKFWKWIKRVIGIVLLAAVVLIGYQGYKLKQQVAQVEKMEPTVAKAVKKYGIEEHESLVLAIILTESKGNHVDVMQSSESKYGSSNEITTSAESIDSGVAYLAKAFQRAQKEGVDQWATVQSYNFGIAYIDYVAKHGDKNTIELAESYSKNELAPTLGNTTAAQYRYLHPYSIAYNGGYLYKNGGNFFYSELIQWNQKVYAFFSKF